MSKFLCVLTSAVCATPSLTVRCLCKLCVFCLQEERTVVLHLLASICLMSEKIILSSSFYVVHLWTVKNICIFLKYERLGHFQNSMITVTVNSYSSIVVRFTALTHLGKARYVTTVVFKVGFLGTPRGIIF